MQSDWPLVPIGEVAQVFDGPHATPKKTNSGPVFLGISSIKNGRLDLSDVEHLSEDDFARWTRRVIPQEEDVVFSYETRLGQAAIIPPGLRCCLGRRMALVRPNRGRLLPRYFLYYFLSSEFQAFLKARTIHGSTVERLPLTDFPSYPVRLPPLETQRAICRVLAAVDDRIDLLRQTNATLESIAQAIFKSWFIDFDPVRAKAEGREPEGMDAAMAALFPGEFEESELGLIPKGWRIGKVEDLFILQRGFDLPASQRTDGSYTVFAASGPHGTHSAAMAQGPGVITGRSGVIGRVFYSHEDYWPLNTALWVRQFRAATPPYAFQYLQTLDLSRLNAGSAVPTLNRNHVHAQPALIPPAGVVSAYTAFAVPLLERIRVNREHATALEALLDALLPRLMSGTVTVLKKKVLPDEVAT